MARDDLVAKGQSGRIDLEPLPLSVVSLCSVNKAAFDKTKQSSHEGCQGNNQSSVTRRPLTSKS